MASVSFGVNRDENYEMAPDTVHVGTLAVTTYNVEVRVDNTKGMTHKDIIMALEKVIRRLEDGRFADVLGV